MKPSQANTLYEILGVEKFASPEEIAEAFRKQVRIWHPDKNVAANEDTNDEFKILMNAFDILSNTYKRSNYDRFQFEKGVRRKIDLQRNEKLAKFRAEQRKIINRELDKNNRDLRVFKILSKVSKWGAAGAFGLFLATFVLALRGLDAANIIGFSASALALVVLNASLISLMIFEYELATVKKRNLNLAIKLYSYVDS
jgi:curved DNA-binding protein CbpA